MRFGFCGHSMNALNDDDSGVTSGRSLTRRRYPVHVWMDKEGGRMRLDVYEGLDKTIAIKVRPAEAAHNMAWRGVAGSGRRRAAGQLQLQHFSSPCSSCQAMTV